MNTNELREKNAAVGSEVYGRDFQKMQTIFVLFSCASIFLFSYFSHFFHKKFLLSKSFTIRKGLQPRFVHHAPALPVGTR